MLEHLQSSILAMAHSSFSFFASQVASKAGLEANLGCMVDVQVLEFAGIEV